MSKYPGEGQIAVWIDDYFNSKEHRGMRYEAFLAMKACDWAREQATLESSKPSAHERVCMCGYATHSCGVFVEGHPYDPDRCFRPHPHGGVCAHLRACHGASQ